ncbi:hypothetical protein ACFQHO_15715 [Actinomadura yumaensis]|uniref:hypothetical protein n=1 Tax=Actinomadura TaxID=1988 RepID=UPI00132B6387|nr:hypothetical protein [Actinomadura sp. J1-007]MWK36216.1 hypothetical protein [Actinomadura sp. J1-007]
MIFFALPGMVIIGYWIAILIGAIIFGHLFLAGIMLVAAPTALVPGAIAYGLWHRRFQTWALVLGVLSPPFGLMVIWLLTTRSSQEWFASPTNL